MANDLFHPAVAAWFEQTFGVATPAQRRAWPAIKQGRHTLIAAPTGSGKTLAAFMSAIDDLVREGLAGSDPMFGSGLMGSDSLFGSDPIKPEPGLKDQVYVLYISPLKALSNDIHKNLDVPLSGITRMLAEQQYKEGFSRLDARLRGHDEGDNSSFPRTPAGTQAVERLMETKPRRELSKEKGSDPSFGSDPFSTLFEIRSAVRTGDTTQTERNRMRQKPPHILVTTPESLFILLTSESGREMLKTVRTVIVDEIHALAGNKRGSHLALSLERLEALCEQHPVRIGLSATQKPLEDIAHYLVGNRNEPCAIVDTGHTRERDLKIIVPDQPLGPLMPEEGWADIYNRLAAIAEENTTTLVFVNNRRLAERAARHLSDRLGEENVTAHHGSLAKEHRLHAEQRLKEGKLKVLVATASLELGIDIGDVSCVCQVGSPHAIAAFLQRVGRSGHQVGGTPKGRLFPLSRDDLLECTALLNAVQRGELDRLHVAPAHIDVLCQQIIAEVACREWQEDELYAQIQKAWPYRALEPEMYDRVLNMLAEGFSTRRGRRSRYLFRDAVNRLLKPRDGARLTAVTNAGAIPDQFDYNVILEPEGIFIGTLNEDFSIESLPGDIVQLGNTSYRILQIGQGKVRVEDAHGQPPNMPFWFGEAPSRTDELSAAVSRLRGSINERLKDGIDGAVGWLLNELNNNESSSTKNRPEVGPPTGFANPDELLVGAAPSPREVAAEGDYTTRHSREEPVPVVVGGDGNPVEQTLPEGQSLLNPSFPRRREPSETNMARQGHTIEPHVARQLVEYLAATKAALGQVPTQQDIVFERFFDEAGDQHLVIHSPYGSRINRAWGLALRKRFCRQFNFELQAAALEDSIVISLGATHSFPLDEVTRYLNPRTVRDVLVQAVLAAPVFMTRWRWAASIALALKRNMGGRRVPAQFQRTDAEDLIAVVFPDQLACQENIAGDREVPDHPLVEQALYDCLHEVMDIDGLIRLLEKLERDEITVHCRDLSGPSPLAQEILFARPYAFLDDAPAEERRTRAVNARRFLDPADAAELATLSPDAIRQVAEEAWPDMSTPDKLHDALMVLGFVVDRHSGNRVSGCPESRSNERFSDKESEIRLFKELAKQNRATTLKTANKTIWVCAERLPQVQAVFPDANMDPAINAVGPAANREWPSDESLVELLRARLEGSGIVSESQLVELFECTPGQMQAALLALEAEGYAMRGNFTGNGSNREMGSDPSCGSPEMGSDPLSGSDPISQCREWCERGLLARIHRYTLKSLRNEIKPVTAADYMRFLFDWHGMTERPEGDGALMAAIDRLEGFPLPAGVWETDILPVRIKGYDSTALDRLCSTGHVMWTRFNPVRSRPKDEPARVSKAGLLRNTPITLLDRYNVDYWRTLQAQPDAQDLALSANATTVLGVLKQQGASFFFDIVRQSGLLRTHAEEALAELAALGVVTSDSYAGLRALITPNDKRPGFSRTRRYRKPVNTQRGIDDAGRWSIISNVPETGSDPSSGSGETGSDPLCGSDPISPKISIQGWITTDMETLNHVAYTLLKRYGVVFHKILERETGLPPWRELLYAWRRMEARGEIRGGRFVEGFTGEQFALPEAVTQLRKHRDGAQTLPPIVISATDPLNLVGVILPGERIPALHTNRILFQNGFPAAKQLNEEIHYFGFISPHAQWEINFLLTRKKNPARFVQATNPYQN